MLSKSALSLFALLTATSSVVLAQQPSGTSTTPNGTLPPLSACVMECIQEQAIADRECSDVDDYQCICTNQHVQSKIAECLAHCTPQDQQAALAALKVQCGAFPGGTSATPTITGTGATVNPITAVTATTLDPAAPTLTVTAIDGGSNAAVGRIGGSGGLGFAALVAGVVGFAF